MAPRSSIPAPFTPQKKEDPINQLARSLNARWNLELPIKDQEYSPSKLGNPARKENQVFGLIKFLYFQYPTALEIATAKFEDEASHLESEWNGRQDDIQRSNENKISAYFSQRKDSVIKQKKFLDTSELINVLFRVLSAARESCLEGPPIHKPNLFTNTPPAKTVADEEHASPFECSIDDADLALLDGDDKEAAPFGEDCEDIFTTPPSSPRQSPETPPVFTGKDLDFKFKRPGLSVGHKRPLPEPTRRISAPKVSRGGEHHVSPCQSVAESPLARSFASTQSSSFVSSVESTQKGLDTAATSFSSEAGSATQANNQLLREAADVRPRLGSTTFDGHPFPQVPEPLPDLLLRESPFTRERSPSYCEESFRQNYELGRIALHCKLDATDFPSKLRDPIMDYSRLWASLKDVGNLPERSKPLAWRKAEMSWTGVSLTGELTYNKGKGGPVFNFQLNPLTVQKSHRLSRQFGGDRFLVVTLPSLQERDLPEYLRRKKKRPEAVRDDILDWLVYTGHHILGRTWRAFFVKPHGPSKSEKLHRTEVAPGAHRVYLFATDGPKFVSDKEYHPDKPFHKAMMIQELLDWFMPSQRNPDQLALKFFARLGLGVSTTIPTISFPPRQIILSDDAYSDSPNERRLNLTRDAEKRRGKKSQNESNVMNDGCALISQDAARAIARHMGLLDGVPCAFQGRIGGAKGIWMVDPLDQRLNKNLDMPDKWIEITDSQLKFQGHRIDDFQPEKNRVTFEVLDWCHPMSASHLNFQIMPILIHGGVPPSVLETMLEEDLLAKAAEMEAAMENPLKLRLWIQENHNSRGERLDKGSIEMQGGLPDTKAERVNWFVEHGFDPKTCKPLKDLCVGLIRDYCLRLEERMNISIGRSTYAYIIADPLAVLAEDEVHFCFSNTFIDSRSGFSDIALDGMDVLVARSPFHLPSDIQRVRAVYHRALAKYKDVIIFPSKGKRALADKLSGGDYDGDKVWICWEPKLVEPFKNSDVHESPGPEYFGIQKDFTKVKDLLKDDDYASNFIRKGFDCNITSPILGLCTNWFDAYCYHGKNSINDPMAKNIAMLLGYLVDSAKAGHTFTEQMWLAFRKRHKLPLSPGKPAYKEKKGANPTNHIIDRLVFNVAQRVIATILKGFETRFGSEAIFRDDDLTAPWKAEDALAKTHGDAKDVMKHVNTELEKVRKFWADNIAVNRDDGDFTSATKRNAALRDAKKKMPFSVLVQICRDMFLAIEPPKLKNPLSYVVDRWISDSDGWNRLKASGAFYRFKGGNSFTWHTCGWELGKIKVAATKNGGRGVEESIHLAMKVDRRFCAVLDVEDEDGSGLRSQIGGEVEDEYGLGNEDWALDDHSYY